MKRTTTKNFKILFALSMVLLLFQSNSSYAIAVEKNPELIVMEDGFGNNVEFNIKKDLVPLISYDELMNISKNHPDADVINIHNIIEPNIDDIETAPNAIINPPPRNISKKYTSYYKNIGQSFVTSVARGATKSFSKSVTYSVNGSVTGQLSASELSIAGSASETYTTTRIFEGPSENSRYRTRNFYIRWEGHEGTYSAEVFIPSQMGWNWTSGSFVEPRRGIEYSTDTNM